MLSANLCLKIYRFIITHKFCNSLDIAMEFNISRRNCLRYIKLLRLHGFIETVRGAGGGIQLKGVY